MESKVPPFKFKVPLNFTNILGTLFCFTILQNIGSPSL